MRSKPPEVGSRLATLREFFDRLVLAAGQAHAGAEQILHGGKGWLSHPVRHAIGTVQERMNHVLSWSEAVRRGIQRAETTVTRTSESSTVIEAVNALRQQAENFQAASRHAGELLRDVGSDKAAASHALQGARVAPITALLDQVERALTETADHSAEVVRNFESAAAEGASIGSFAVAFAASVGPREAPAAALSIPPTHRTSPEILAIFRTIGRQSKRSKQVQLVDSDGELRAAYQILAQGGTAMELKQRDIDRVGFLDGTTVALREESRSGGPTIDIDSPEVMKVRKVHIDYDAN